MVGLAAESVVGAPVHPFWFVGELPYPGMPAKPHANVLVARQSPLIWLLMLALVIEIMAVTTGEDPSTVQDGYATVAAKCRAAEPGSAAAIVAWRKFERYRVVLTLPRFVKTAVAVGEPYIIHFGSYVDVSYRLPVP